MIAIQAPDKCNSLHLMMSLQSIMFVFFIDLAPLVWSWTAKVAPREKQWTDDFSHLPGTIRMIQNYPDAPPSDLHNNSQPREPADSDQTPKSCSSAQDSCSSVVGFLLKCPGFPAQVPRISCSSVPGFCTTNHLSRWWITTAKCSYFRMGLMRRKIGPYGPSPFLSALDPATQMRETRQSVLFSASSRQRCNCDRSSASSTDIFIIARRSRPGTSAQTNQVDRLISTTTTNVPSMASEVREQFSSNVS